MAVEATQLPLRVLTLDDDPATVAVLGRILAGEHWRVFPAQSVREARSLLGDSVPDVAIVDAYLGQDDGLAFVKELRERLPRIAIVVISSEDTATLAMMAIDSGADYFLSKPVSPAALSLTVRRLSDLSRSRGRTEALEKTLQQTLRERTFPGILTHSDSMRAVLKLVEKVSPLDLSVLICGESGTGKELVARSIHEGSPRARGNFVEVNCSALPPNLVESELFGHEKGAFTGAIASRSGKIEQASGGTLFLDEIGELPLEMQPKLLRALQERRISRIGGRGMIDCDFRLVCATNRDLVEEVKAGRFRDDLFYRIAVFPIRVPPLRERPVDLDLLLTHFLAEQSSVPTTLTPRAAAILRAYHWPGNVRELKNFAQAAGLICDNGVIDEGNVRTYFGTRLALDPWENEQSPQRPVRTLEELQRRETLHALRLYKGNVAATATALGLGRATMYKYLRTNNIDPEQPPEV